jgi:hypothetical protein
MPGIMTRYRPGMEMYVVKGLRADALLDDLHDTSARGGGTS